MNEKKYLIGKGERLTRPIDFPKRNPHDKIYPYTFSEAKEKLLPKLYKVVDSVKSMPDILCPNNETVVMLSLHPNFLAKSYYPKKLIRDNNLHAIGSKQIEFKPSLDDKNLELNKKRISYEIFTSGKIFYFETLLNSLQNMSEDSPYADDIRKLEDIYILDPRKKIKNSKSDKEDLLFEVVLHADESEDSDYILNGLHHYLSSSFNITPDFEKRMYSGGLCFFPLKAKASYIQDIAKYPFVRIIREMPRMRLFPGSSLRLASKENDVFTLPDSDSIDKKLRVAIFDGGLDDICQKCYYRWVRYYNGKNVSSPVKEYQEHGAMVTSSLLFGPLKEGNPIETPYADIDHYRILDDNSESIDDPELFEILERITDILGSKEYDFINLSLGPDLPIDDDEPHVWSSVLDKYFEDGTILASIAVGNSGENDVESGNARIQPPSDCINALAIGSCNTINDNWDRAPYSSIGPGRTPGRVKPDALFFGGSINEPFITLLPTPDNILINSTMGTSFASPSALRMGLGIKAFFGREISLLAIKALLLHHTEKNGNNIIETGWGRIPSKLDTLVECKDGEVHIVYQGFFEPSKVIRADIPLPNREKLEGKIEITATFCFNSKVDPQDPVNYTRSGLNITFRPDKDKYGNDEAQRPKTSSFFTKGMYSTEDELRNDSHKWETTLHATKRFLAKSLNDPYFEIHYLAREHGGAALKPERINYALIISVKSKKMKNIYNEVLLRYRTVLEELRPVVEIPIKI